jgi:hypothetical protein
MRRKVVLKCAATAACLALALVPYLLDVRHAGYYVAAGAFGGGLVLGFAAIVVELVACQVLAAVLYLTGWMQPEQTDQSPVILFPLLALMGLYFAVPVLAGAIVRVALARGLRVQTR